MNGHRPGLPPAQGGPAPEPLATVQANAEALGGTSRRSTRRPPPTSLLGSSPAWHGNPGGRLRDASSQRSHRSRPAGSGARSCATSMRRRVAARPRPSCGRKAIALVAVLVLSVGALGTAGAFVIRTTLDRQPVPPTVAAPSPVVTPDPTSTPPATPPRRPLTTSPIAGPDRDATVRNARPRPPARRYVPAGRSPDGGARCDGPAGTDPDTPASGSTGATRADAASPPTPRADRTQKPRPTPKAEKTPEAPTHAQGRPDAAAPTHREGRPDASARHGRGADNQTRRDPRVTKVPSEP